MTAHHSSDAPRLSDVPDWTYLLDESMLSIDTVRPVEAR